MMWLARRGHWSLLLLLGAWPMADPTFTPGILRFGFFFLPGGPGQGAVGLAGYVVSLLGEGKVIQYQLTLPEGLTLQQALTLSQEEIVPGRRRRERTFLYQQIGSGSRLSSLKIHVGNVPAKVGGLGIGLESLLPIGNRLLLVSLCGSHLSQFFIEVGSLGVLGQGSRPGRQGEGILAEALVDVAPEDVGIFIMRKHRHNVLEESQCL